VREDWSGRLGLPIQIEVVEDNGHPVPGQAHIQFDGIRAKVHGALECGQGILRDPLSNSTMGYYLKE
jgi:hypothetical protein